MQALEVMEREDIHLILLDIMMPEMDGISAMVKIREKSNVPIILLTAKSEDTDKILGLSMGADDYVTKPYNPQELAPGYGASCAATPCWEMFTRRSVRARLSTDACPMTQSAVN